MKLRAVLPGLPLVMMGCVELQAVPIGVMDPLPIENACGAADLQGLVGQSATVLRTMRFGVQTRIIRPDEAVTMDFSPSRLNIEIDDHEVISLVSCG